MYKPSSWPFGRGTTRSLKLRSPWLTTYIHWDDPPRSPQTHIHLTFARTYTQHGGFHPMAKTQNIHPTKQKFKTSETSGMSITPEK